LLNESKQEIDEAKGVSVRALPRQIVLRANPDPDFANALPKEARYRVTRWRITLASGGDIKQRSEPSAEAFNLNAWRSIVKKGDRVVVEIFEVQRANYKNDAEKVSMSKVTKQFTLL